MSSTTVETKTTVTPVEDFLPLYGTDYVEFYVGNAKQAAHFIKRHLVFNLSV